MMNFIFKIKYLWIPILALFLALVLILVGATFGGEEQAYFEKAPLPSAIPTPVPTAPPATPTPTPVPTPTPILANPAHMVYAGIGIDADIDPVGLDGDAMGVIHSNTVISWFDLSKMPGEKGNMILAAHRRWKKQDGPFVRLGDSSEGDAVTITDDLGQSWEYVVERVERILYIDPPAYVMDIGGDERITLITCIGTFSQEYGTAEERIVVILKPVDQSFPDA